MNFFLATVEEKYRENQAYCNLKKKKIVPRIYFTIFFFYSNMSNPVMIVRKIKHINHRKIDTLGEGVLKLQNLHPEDSRQNLSKSFGPSQASIILKKSRSSSMLKQKLLQKAETPLNNKARNRSHFIGSTTESLDVSKHSRPSVPIADSNSKNIEMLEKWTVEQLKSQPAEKSFEIFAAALKKLPFYDQKLKNFIDTTVLGMENCFEKQAENVQISKQQSEKLSCQNAELKKLISSLAAEKINYNKKLKDLNTALKFMKKKGVPVEEYFKEFTHLRSTKTIQEIEPNLKKPSLIPKLELCPPSEIGFHQEFMAKVDEFSDSWRALIKQEKLST